MEQMNLTENVDILFRSLENFVQNEGIIGKPVTHEQKTFLPVVSVTIGYGGGNGSMNTANNSSTATTGSGSGALGLGAKLCTDAIICIDNQTVTMLPMNPNASQIMDKIPQIISGLNQNKQSQNQSQQ